jgi:predicted MFS family arabinose efflux permease
MADPDVLAQGAIASLFSYLHRNQVSNDIATLPPILVARARLSSTRAVVTVARDVCGSIRAALQIFRLTGHSSAHMGLAALTNVGAGLLASPLGGVMAERMDRRRLMMACDLVRLSLVLALPWTDRVALLLALAGALSAATAVFSPARQAMIPALVPTQKLDLANSLIGGSQSAIFLLGPLLGAWLYVAGGLRPVVTLDAASYLVSFALLWGLGPRVEPRRLAPEQRRFWRDLAEGVTQVGRRPDLALLLALSMAAGLAVGVVIPLLRPFVGDSLSEGDATYAVILGCFGIGGLVGPWLAMLAMRWIGLGRALLAGFLIEATLMLIWSRTGDVAVNGAVFGVWGAFVFALIPCEHTYLHAQTSPALMARTFALMDQAMYATQIVGGVIVIAVGNAVRPSTLVTVVAVFYLAVVVARWRSSGARLVRSVGRLTDPAPRPSE